MVWRADNNLRVLCDFQGKTVITDNTGNQLGFCFICQAEYDGPSDEFLEAWFH